MSSRLVTWKRIALVSSLAACLCSSAFADAISDAKAYAAKELQIKGNIVDEAANEKTLVMYNLVYPKGLDGVLDKFRTHFPFIKVTSFSLSGGALFERFRTEERSGRHTADIWQHSSPGSADILAEEKLLLDWTPPTDKLIDNKWKSKGHWYPVGLYHIGVAWNTKLVDAQTEKMLMGLKTWKDVAAVDWKEPIGFAHVRTGGTAYLPLYYLQKTFGEPYFEKLAAKKPMVLDSNVPLAERLAAGEITVALTALDTVFSNQWSRGAPIRWIYPEPALGSVYLMALSAKAPHSNAAKLFLAWSLTAEGQRAWSDVSGLAPASNLVPDTRAFTKEAWYHAPKNYLQYNWKDINDGLPAVFKTFSRLY